MPGGMDGAAFFAPVLVNGYVVGSLFHEESESVYIDLLALLIRWRIRQWSFLQMDIHNLFKCRYMQENIEGVMLFNGQGLHLYVDVVRSGDPWPQPF